MSEVKSCMHGRNFCLECHAALTEQEINTKLDAALEREAALREELAGANRRLGACINQIEEQQQRLTVAERRNVALEAALKFYADGDHLLLADADAWDTCSGEPINFLHDEAGTASVEDGSIAKAALKPAEAAAPIDDQW